MKLARRRGRNAHSWRVGFKPQSTILSREGRGLLLAALKAWETRQNGGRYLSQWDIVKLKRDQKHGV